MLYSFQFQGLTALFVAVLHIATVPCNQEDNTHINEISQARTSLIPTDSVNLTNGASIYNSTQSNEQETHTSCVKLVYLEAWTVVMFAVIQIVGGGVAMFKENCKYTFRTPFKAVLCFVSTVLLNIMLHFFH